MKFELKTALLVSIFLFFVGCRLEREVVLSGKTMGTIYHIKIVAGYFQNTKKLARNIDKRLAGINKSMSTYIKESEINRFNRMLETDKKFKISKDFAKVMETALQVHRLTDGAWDGTVKPLVDLWGFGNKIWENSIPDADNIKKVFQNIGFDKIVLVDKRYLVKKKSRNNNRFSINSKRICS
mmetsp:Transcript_4917/g.2738  ORF Transcript_4917/g.2738 Transcript_4917/m.2738 type:complete len:182 (+) Transcript_4917:1627-2172(+)